MVEAQHLRKTFSNTVAVNDVSFRVRRGEVLGLLGPNGAGKTTTIRILLGIFRPDSGEVLFDGKPFSDSLRSESGYLPEERGLYRKSTLGDTLLYFALLRGMNRSAARRSADEWLAKLDLSMYSRRRVEELSKGNQQKVQFIVSVIHDPWLLVLDEPFSGLDPVNQEVLQEILTDLRKEGKAIVFSTHQMDQAERMSDHLCLIHKGEVVLEGTVNSVKRTFGGNSLRIEFSGDGKFIPTLPGVKNAVVYPHFAELQLHDGYSPSGILPHIVGRLDLRRFEIHEPSLQSIFMDVVRSRGGNRTAGGGA